MIAGFVFDICRNSVFGFSGIFLFWRDPLLDRFFLTKSAMRATPPTAPAAEAPLASPAPAGPEPRHSPVERIVNPHTPPKPWIKRT